MSRVTLYAGLHCGGNVVVEDWKRIASLNHEAAERLWTIAARWLSVWPGDTVWCVPTTVQRADYTPREIERQDATRARAIARSR